jgi:N-acetyl-anhydromuramyl-L-alanine amidase AmpD
MIKIDDKIRMKWHRGFERPFKPTELILHGTAGGGTYNYVFNGGRKELYVQGIALFHFLIDVNGETTEIISPDRWVYHSSSGKHDEKTIGIEMINQSADNSKEYTIDQYRALFDLLVELLPRYPINLIRSHNATKMIYSGSGKKCPGNFRWDDLGEWLADSRYDFTREYECFSNIKKMSISKIEPEEKNEKDS